MWPDSAAPPRVEVMLTPVPTTLGESLPSAVGTVAAEVGDDAAVFHGADRQRILGGTEIGEAVQPAVRLGHDVELRVPVDHRVQLALAHAPAGEFKRSRSKTHVDDQGFDLFRLRSLPQTACRMRQVVHAAANVVQASVRKRRQYLAHAQVTHAGRDSGQYGTVSTRPRYRAEDMGTVAVHVHPEIPVLIAIEVGATDAGAAMRDVHMARVEPGVKNPDRNSRTGDTGKSFHCRVILSKTIGAHDWHGRVMGHRH